MGLLSSIGLDSSSLGGLLNAATLGLANIGGTLLGNKQQAGYTKKYLYLQQAFAERNAAIAHQYELDTLAKTGCQSATQQYNAYKYDKRLAKYNQELQALSAAQDYERALKYITDSQAAYKQALVANGYNPILALGSSIPSYGGHTNSASLGSVGSPVGQAATAAKPVQGSIPAAPYSDYGASFTSGFSNAINFARVASDIKRNEAASLADRARAAHDLEGAKSESQQRNPSTAKIYSEVARNAITSTGSAVGGVLLANKANKLMSAVKSGNPQKIAQSVGKVTDSVAREGNSAFLGSRVLQAVLPLAAGASGIGAAGYGGFKLRESLYDKSPNARKMIDNDATVRKYGRGMW